MYVCIYVFVSVEHRMAFTYLHNTKYVTVSDTVISYSDGVLCTYKVQ